MIVLEFHGEHDFEAARAAEAWCQNLGISVGPMQGSAPRGLSFGAFQIGKWRNLTKTEQEFCDGRMCFTRDPRRGRVVIWIADPRIPSEINLSAPLNLARLETLKLAQAELDLMGIRSEGVAA